MLSRLRLSGGPGENGKIAPPSPGLYHYQYQGEGENSRVHLRIEEDHRGILLVNASRVLHLNESAAFMAFLALQKVTADQAVKSLRNTYSISSSQARYDYAQFSDQLLELIRPDGACPIHDLELDITAPFSARPSAPYRMDLALTYRCNNDCAHCYNARPRDFTEISTSEWKMILDQLWALGIPHIVFTGGEPTLRDDLPELVAHAERNGQITGLNTNARRLSDKAFLQNLVEAGLDHVQITLESHKPEIHDAMVCRKAAWSQTVQGLKNALSSRLFVMTNTTLLQDNSLFLEGTLDFLGTLGVPTIGLNALIYSGRGLTVGKGLPESALPPLLELAQQKTLQYGQRLIWYTPTQYCNFDPLILDLGVKGCTAALYNMCIEPNGDVLPCQSYYQPVGNMLRNDWDRIWNHELSIRLRERQGLPEKCHTCALLAECGGGCPLMNGERF
jgi:radical SAM protein with 4Fe4S-binding SPASM domain